MVKLSNISMRNNETFMMYKYVDLYFLEYLSALDQKKPYLR